MNSAEALDSVRAEVAALEHIASLVYELNSRLRWLIDVEIGGMSQREIDARISLVRDVWGRLDELGVDLNVPDLKALVAAHVATHQTPGGAVRSEASSTVADPASPGQKSSGAVSVGGIPPVQHAASPPAPLGADQPGYFDEEGWS